MARGMTNFGIIGVAGYVAPRHLKAIKETGNRLTLAVDPHDSVGALDQYFPEAHFFTEVERFLSRMEREPVDYVSVCSPNYLHDAHMRLALHAGAHAICEKPLVIDPADLTSLEELQQSTGKSVSTILQLRLHPEVLRIRDAALAAAGRGPIDVCMSYVTSRGPWYHESWKGSQSKSGGLAFNIGIHLFDLLIALFGDSEESEVHLSRPDRLSGFLSLARARVRWFLSVNSADLPPQARGSATGAFRSMTFDGREVEFSSGFADLHTESYRNILAGKGFTIGDALPSIRLAHSIGRAATVTPSPDRRHPFLER